MSLKQRNVVIERGVKISHSGAADVAAHHEHGSDDFAKMTVHHIREMNGKREHEKQELQVLNQRFSSYVERVRALEAMNRKLLADIDDLKSKWGFDSGKIKDLMEPELLKFRELIDEITRLKAVSEIKAKRAESDALQFKNLMDLAMETFNADKTKIANLERLLDNTAQDGDYLRGQLNDINDQIAKYVEEQRRLTEQLRQLKDDLDRETIDRVARQNEVQTLEEQISFLKAVHEQEVSELSRLQTIVGFDPAQFYRNELERAIRDIRGDFEQLNVEQKRELEEWYRIKTEEVEKEVIKEREFQRASTIGLSVEETNSLKQTHLDSQREYAELQRRHSEYSARLRELEERLEQSKQTNQLTCTEKDREIGTLREKIQELMATYDELMNRKTSLEFEINTYRRLLECEETRIRTNVNGNTNISTNSSSSKGQQSRSAGGSNKIELQSVSGNNSASAGYSSASYSSSSASVTRAQVSSSNTTSVGGSATLLPSSGTVNMVSQTVVLPPNQQHQHQQSAASAAAAAAAAEIQANRQQFGSVQSSSASSSRGPSSEMASETITKRMQVQRTSKGPVGIKEISPDGKFVLIENTGKRGDLDISRWQIKRKVDNEPDIIFVFPSNTIIGSGRTVKIWSRGQGRSNLPNEFVHEVEWRSGDAMVTRLISESGEERALYSQRSSQ